MRIELATKHSIHTVSSIIYIHTQRVGSGVGRIELCNSALLGRIDSYKRVNRPIISLKTTRNNIHDIKILDVDTDYKIHRALCKMFLVMGNIETINYKTLVCHTNSLVIHKHISGWVA